MRVVSLKMNSNDYPLKNTNYHYLLLNTTIIPLRNGKISLFFLGGKPPCFMEVFSEEGEQIYQFNLKSKTT